MGCFDFHYADRFINMNNRGGYYVLPDYLKEDLDLKNNYIRFKSSDDYGRLFLEKGEQGDFFDIYNLYSIQIMSYYKDKLGIDSEFIKRLYSKIYEEDFDIRHLGITFNCIQDFVLSDINMRYGDSSHYDDNNYLINLATFEETPLIITMFKPKDNFEDFEYVTKSGQNYGRKLKCKWLKDNSYNNLLPTKLKEFDSELFREKIKEYKEIEDSDLRSKKISKLFLERDEMKEYNSRFINKKAYEDLKMLKHSLRIFSDEIIKKFK